jgi:CRISPR-associated endonuclease Csn1
MKDKEYYLGLDMGTASVGWAVTDENYHLIRKKGKDLWGIREFEEALTAVDRRTKRTSRRRRQRETARIGLLKEYFHDAITQKDEMFYSRLENSKYHIEDKDENVRYKNVLFCDADYTDKDYFKEFPTIFHLRKALLASPGTHAVRQDVRLVYLALLNMFKHRGHFLNTSLSEDGGNRRLSEAYTDLRNMLIEELEISFPEANSDQMLDILTDKELSRTRKKEELAKLLEIERKDKCKMEFVKAICGLKASAKLLFENFEADGNEKIEICFAEYGYEEKAADISATLGETYYGVVELLKEIYDICTLANIMKGYSYLSEARVAEYEKHGTDLKILKRTLKRYRTIKEYNNFFREHKEGSYCAYIGSVNSKKKLRRNIKERKQEDLYKSIKRLLRGLPESDADVAYILGELDKGSFLPKQLTPSNGVIPNQVHIKEMKKILENAETYLPFLKERDEYGLTISERILKLFSFQIPYYIGPTTKKSKTGWVIRKAPGPVLPWNIEEKIDIKKTSEEFVSKMVRRCSYINGEKVLPKASLLYESFCVLNEINTISIDGERIPVSLKQGIYTALYKKGKKVTRKQLVNYLRAQGALSDESQLSGIDVTPNNALSTYGKFKTILGKKIDEDDGKQMVENIVFWCTIYGDSKRLLRETLSEHYGNVLSAEQIKRIAGIKFKDWGRLSKAFLTLPGCQKSIGEKTSLVRMMWETNFNLMELLNHPDYSYREELDARQEKGLKPLSQMLAEDLDEFSFSAPVKRMVWQTLLVIRELESVLGAPPKRLFVEMTRKPDDKKGRTITRKQKFLNLYQNIDKEIKDWKEEIEKADANGTLKSKKMYLYFTQMGRCMYTGEEIELSQLFNDNIYDIDHIYPRHFVKDDNLDNNLVLVKKTVNAYKSDIYPLEASIYETQKENWKRLYHANLITEEKYKRLMGRAPFTDEQKADFIARQLVETRQGTKGVTDILKNLLPNTTIVYSKASNVSEFRQKRDLIKCRNINEFHHAQDAYLNIVVGNVYYVKFTQNPLHFIQKEYSRNAAQYQYNLSRMFDRDVVRGNETAWIGSKNDKTPGTIATVKKMMAKNTPLMTRQNFEGHGGIADETLYGAQKATAKNYIPLKSSDTKLADVTKYGGFSSVSTAYFFLVEHGAANKRTRTLETVPIYMKEKINDKEELLLKYCTDVLKLTNPCIRLPKIKLQSLIKKDGYFMHISGKTGNQIALRNAVNLCLRQEWISYIRKLEKHQDSGSDCLCTEKNIVLYALLVNKHKKGIYAKRPNPFGEKLDASLENFKGLALSEQCEVLNQILRLTSIGITCADLTLLGESPNSGKMLMSKNISKSKELLLLNQSVTGIFESRIDLLTV